MKKRIFLLDLDGTLFSGSKPMPYAFEFVNYLNEFKFKYYVITNCPEKSNYEISMKLKLMNIQVSPEKILTSGFVASEILSKRLKLKTVYTNGTDALRSELLRNDIFLSESNPQAVLIGFNTDVSFESFCNAIKFIRNGAEFYATNCDNTIPSGEEVIPHTGSFVKLIESATDKQCKYFGKPDKYFFDIIQSYLPCPKEEFVMVGDRIDTDVLFAANSGIESYLINNESKSNLNFTSYKNLPKVILNNLGDLLAEKEKYFFCNS